jgi:enoyl-CoA hydratase
MEFVQVSDQDGIRALRLEHGKPNSISQAVAEELSSALAEAAKADDVKAIVLLGRAGMFSGGFDLGTMGQGAAAARDMVIAGGRVLMDIYDHPKPIVVGCGGHAIAMGAFLVMACDERIGADGSFKIGANETAIGMTLPDFAIEICHARLSKRHFDRVTVHSTILDPKGAVDAGILDRVVDPDRLEAEAFAAAARLGELKQPAFRNNKRLAHGSVAERVRAGIVENLTKQMGG